MRSFLFATAMLVATVSACAADDKQPTITDLEFNQRAVIALQAQRNAALDAQAVTEAKLTAYYNQLQAANAKIKELEDKLKSEDKTKETPPQKK